MRSKLLITVFASSSSSSSSAISISSGISSSSSDSLLYSPSLSSRTFFSFRTFWAFFWSSQNPAFRLSPSSSCILFARPAGSKITSHFLYLLLHSRKLTFYFVQLYHHASDRSYIISSSSSGLLIQYVGAKPQAARSSSSI